ncbi:MAG: UDP-N-acetylmuramate dehydrogenase [Clostridia bacterium]|nr:UDP-N-acetylmuramate dehydrogenase [Clostridia bacterium]
MLLYKSGLKKCIDEPKIQIVSPFKFSENTTYGLGGNAIAAYQPKTVYEAKIAFDRLTSNGIPFEILGNGSNVLVSDKGIGGAVISTNNLRGIIRLDKNRLLCLAGTRTGELLAYCKKHSLGGLEYLYGIPASLGGAVFMNAGVNGAAIGKNVECVRIYDGKSRVLTREMCNFAYRHSTMRDIKALILSIIVNVCDSSSEEIEERLTFYKQRRSHLPKGKSCGCVFKNPDGVSAGYLIDNAGLKGFRVGGAYVSDRHASFIINDGGSASDVKALIDIVKSKVLDKFGILLNEEVVYIGEFNDFNG